VKSSQNLEKPSATVYWRASSTVQSSIELHSHQPRKRKAAAILEILAHKNNKLKRAETDLLENVNVLDAEFESFHMLL
jgi:hypothetical protein